MKKQPFDKYKIVDERFGFETWFDRKSGSYLRSGILDSAGKDTGADPFMASFPHLLDIGIMGHCEHGLSGACSLAGIQCYQDGGNVALPNMSFENFKRIADQCEGRVHQFALGGRGDPDMHENFEEIVYYSRKLGIVPNITTSGYGMTSKKAKLIANYCGAAAVSYYRKEYTQKAIEMLTNEGISTNLHFVLGNNSIDEAIELLKNGKLPKGVSRTIFLLFKPVGQGNYENILSVTDERIKVLFSLFDDPKIVDIVGYDSCSVPALVHFKSKIDPQSFDTCEGARFSAYISADMKMMPCSFDQQEKYAVSLNTMSIEEIWNSREFDEFRTVLGNSCPDCEKNKICLGGCPIVPEIVLCGEKQRIYKGGKQYEV